MNKNATIKDVAKLAGVSISVVSYVLNNTAGITITPETRKRVLDAARELCYVPNRSASGLRTKRAMSIGIVCYWSMSGLVFNHLLQGITNVATLNGYRLVLCSNSDPSDEFFYLDYFRDSTIDGIIFVSPHEEYGSVDEAAHIAKMQKVGIPFVMVNGHLESDKAALVNVDFYGSTHLATTWFIDRGHHDITYVAPTYSFHEYYERLRGYLDAMTERGLTPDVCPIDDVEKRISSFRAVIANKCDSALVVMKAAAAAGISIPGELSLISGNSEEYCDYVTPAISSVLVPTGKMGEKAVSILIDKMNGREPAQIPDPQCSLVIRETC